MKLQDTLLPIKSILPRTSLGAPVAHWVKGWPIDQAVPSSSPALGKIFSTINGVPLHTAYCYHMPNLLIWLKYCWKGCKISNHPSIVLHYEITTKKWNGLVAYSTIKTCAKNLQQKYFSYRGRDDISVWTLFEYSQTVCRQKLIDSHIRIKRRFC